MSPFDELHPNRPCNMCLVTENRSSHSHAHALRRLGVMSTLSLERNKNSLPSRLQTSQMHTTQETQCLLSNYQLYLRRTDY
uniref:Uncharacterized protein n=1 Tax=Nelumbo nucifera TaxID=4432 RepID=A0A822XJF5_NELNU|nr:TPA_asm: hypothetical protein HUJ06_020754 [Nelumbo nucifera]